MPSDQTHVIFNFIAYTVISTIHFSQPLLSLLQFALFSLFFIIGTLILNPDLDTKSKSARRCGVVCLPYRAAFSHRGASHHWLLGVATRIAYVVLVAIVVILVLGIAIKAQDIDSLWALASSYKLEILAGLLGLFASNFLHIILDKLAS